MNLAPYTAAVVDFDRTLLCTDKTLSAETVRVLLDWRKSGRYLFAATARPERAITSYCARIPFDAVTTLNGARTITKGAVFEYPLPPESASFILDRLCRLEGMVISVEAENGIYANTDIPLWAPVVTDHIQALPEKEKIYKVLASHPSVPVEKIDIPLPGDVYSSVADGKLVQYMSAEATKWHGVLKMLEAYRIPAEQVVYFGDDNDDVEPLRRCGCGVAVSNAIGAALEAADYVTGSNDEDGVAAFLSGLLKGAEGKA